MKNSPVIIRSFQKTDEAVVLSLWNETFPSEPTWSSHTMAIKRKLVNHPELFLVAEIDDNVVGTVIAGIDGTRAWIYYVAVAQAFQRQGIGTALIKHAETDLTQLGYPQVNLQVRESSAEIVRFYKRLGYDVESKISMAKRLQEG